MWSPDPESQEQAMKGGKGGGKGGKAHDKGRGNGVGKQHGKTWQVMKCPRAGSGGMGNVLGKQLYHGENNPGVAASSTAPRAHKQNGHPSNSQKPEPGRHWQVRERDRFMKMVLIPQFQHVEAKGFLVPIPLTSTSSPANYRNVINAKAQVIMPPISWKLTRTLMRHATTPRAKYRWL